MLGTDTHAGDPTSACRLAGCVVSASAPVPALPSLLPCHLAEAPPPGRPLDGPGELLPGSPFTARLGDEEVLVAARRSPQGLRVEAEGFGSVLVSERGDEVFWYPSGEAARERPELVLGPGLVLALAFRGVFCLHASAVLGPAGAVVFAAASGAGKSTLAARLAADAGLPRLADDILPVTAAASGASALPHFPQLKLPPSGQYPPVAAGTVPIDRLFVLAPCRLDEPVAARPLPPSVAALSVCGQAVASRLFPEGLLARLVEFAAGFVSAVRVTELSYPHRPGAVADVLRLIREA